jgi:ABC-type nitrate/sulfonate/bicarbonate transport system substrate-binding protein
MPAVITESSSVTDHSMPFIANTSSVKLGYVRLIDAAPYIIAHELGIYSELDLNVDLYREVGWATVRNKISYGHLDMAQALAPIPLAMSLGLYSNSKIPSQAVLITSRNGNAITLSNDLWKRDVRDAKSLAREIRGTRSIRRYTFGVVAPYSTHDLILRRWLSNAGIDTENDVRIVVLPPEQMVRSLMSGNIDGYCVGEPWNSVAVRQKAGWCPVSSADLHPGHPEKVLMAPTSFIRRQPEQVDLMVRALLKACLWCDQPENREQLADILSHRNYLDCHKQILIQALSSSFPMGHRRLRDKGDFVTFFKNEANRPGQHEAEWIVDGLRQADSLNALNHPSAKQISTIYDPSFYDRAIRSIY